MSLLDGVQTLAAELGLRIRDARQRRRWTTEELAAKLEVSERTVRKLERGAPSVALGTALAACLILDVSFEGEVSRHIHSKRVRKPPAPVISDSEVDF